MAGDGRRVLPHGGSLSGILLVAVCAYIHEQSSLWNYCTVSVCLSMKEWRA